MMYFASVSPVYIREPYRKTVFLINGLVMTEIVRKMYFRTFPSKNIIFGMFS